MILDICKFCFLYLLVLFSFSCGKKFLLSLETQKINQLFIRRHESTPVVLCRLGKTKMFDGDE